MDYVIAVDVGGTCTDCVVVDSEGRVTLGKAFSTPPDFSEGIIDAMAVAADSLGLTVDELLEMTRLFLPHASTVAENAVTDGNLARVGIITTRGFEDTLVATRGGYGRWSGLTEDEKRNPIYTDKPPAIVPRSMVRGVKERTDCRGLQLVPVDPAQVRRAAEELVEARAQALAICFLWATANPENERAAARVIRERWPDLFLSVSHEVAPVIGEYERMSTAALNSGLGPVVRNYLLNLSTRLAARGFKGTTLVGQGYGGLLPLESAAERPVGLIESGPVAGVMGSKWLGERMGFSNIIAADMGGTTFKVGVIREGLVEYQREPMVYRYHFAAPKMDVVSLGLAGGSIIHVDPRTGIPHVGPRSAGSVPGPVCYGRGGEDPTVTDCDAILGYLNPRYFLGGRAPLDVDSAYRAFEDKVARPLGMSVTEAAAAIYRLVNSMIYDLLHKVTVERGLDPRKFALFSFGGTAGMHVSAYGEALGVRCIVVPHSASVHGAFGLVTSDVVHEAMASFPMRVPADPSQVNEIFRSLEEKVVGQLLKEGFSPEEISVHRSVDMRYRRQVHVVTVPVPGRENLGATDMERVVDEFERLYRTKYGPESAFREAGIDLVAFRLRASGTVRKPEIAVSDAVGEADASGAVVEVRPAYVDLLGRMETVPGYDFELLRPGHRVQGPAIIWTPITTVVISPGQAAAVDRFKNLVIAREEVLLA